MAKARREVVIVQQPSSTHCSQVSRGARVPATARSADGSFLFIPDGIGKEIKPDTQPLSCTFRCVSVTTPFSVSLILFETFER